MSTGTNSLGTVFRDVRIFTGERVIPRGSVVVRDGVIAEAGAAPAPGAHVVDGAGRTLLPGLIDAHTHVFPGSLEQAIRFGVTTELDMFSMPASRPAAPGPDMADFRTASVGATAPGGHPAQFMSETFGAFPTVSGPGAAAAFVAARVAEGADYLKILIEDGAGMGVPLPTLDHETVRALVTAAHAAGLIAIAHATTLPCARVAVDAGVDGLAHVFVTGDAEPAEVESFVARLVDRDVFVVATLALCEALAGEPAATELAEDPRIGPALPAGLRAAVGRPMPGFPPIAGMYRDALGTTALLHRSGVTVLAGTDANDGPHGPFPVVHGATMHRELVCLGAAGLTPTEVLAAATSAPADRFGLTDRGRIAPGRRADLVLVDGDPTTDLTATRSIAGVWRGGSPVANAVKGRLS